MTITQFRHMRAVWETLHYPQEALNYFIIGVYSRDVEERPLFGDSFLYGLTRAFDIRRKIYEQFISYRPDLRVADQLVAHCGTRFFILGESGWVDGDLLPEDSPIPHFPRFTGRRARVFRESSRVDYEAGLAPQRNAPRWR